MGPPSRSWRSMNDPSVDVDTHTDAEVSSIFWPAAHDVGRAARHEYGSSNRGLGPGGLPGPVYDVGEVDSWTEGGQGLGGDRAWDAAAARAKVGHVGDARDAHEPSALPTQHVPSPIRPRASSRGSEDSATRLSASPGRVGSATEPTGSSKLYASPLLVSDPLRTRFETPPRAEPGFVQVRKRPFHVCLVACARPPPRFPRYLLTAPCCALYGVAFVVIVVACGPCRCPAAWKRCRCRR